MPVSWYRYDPDYDLLTLTLHVQPNARRTEIAGFHDGQLKVRTAAPAVEGKANELLVRVITDKFDLPGGRVMIRRGSHGRTKIIELYGQAAWIIELYGQAACLLARVKKLAHS